MIMEWSGKIMNMHNKKTQRTIAAVIVMVLVLAMVIPSFLSIVGV